MYLLNKSQYTQALASLEPVNINHLFARFVVEKYVTGIVYGNDPEKPDAFYVIHPYGMSFLYGNTEHEDFNRKILDYLLNNNGDRESVEWLQAYPNDWNKIIESMLGNRMVKSSNAGIAEHNKVVEENTRLNFRFDPSKYKSFRSDLGNCNQQIVRTNSILYDQMQGTVVPGHFWDSADDFSTKGVGFSIVINNHPVCTAYSAFILKGLLELGIETAFEYRGKGFALHTCSALIDYCIDHGYEPIWSCRLENTGSYKLAQRLGFEETLRLPYYKLPV